MIPTPDSDYSADASRRRFVVSPPIRECLIEHFFELLQSQDSVAITLYAIGVLELHEDNQVAAIRQFSHALQLDFECPTALGALASNLIDNGSGALRFARRLVDTACQMCPSSPELLAIRGEILFRLGEWDSALKDLWRAIPSLTVSDRAELILKELCDTMRDEGSLE